MDKMIKGMLCAGFMFLGMAAPVFADLISRLNGQAVYDTDLDITWLADPNAAAGSIFDDKSFSTALGSTTDGLLTWGNARRWTKSLTVGGVSDWRLPTTDPGCGEFKLCTRGELGHLFTELGGTGNNSPLSSGDPDLALFSFKPDLGPAFFWTATDINEVGVSIPGNPFAWTYNFVNGQQVFVPKRHAWHAWAVRSGDIGKGHISAPATILLVMGGLLLLPAFRHRQ